MSASYVEQISELKESDYLPLVIMALEEDHYKNDITSLSIFDQKHQSSANIISNMEGIICGLEIIHSVFRYVDSNLEIATKFKDGNRIFKDNIILQIKGNTNSLLSAERVALNFLGMLSGIATKVDTIVKQLNPFQIQLLDTRKTIPGFRLLEKYAVAKGGGVNHRLHLEDLILIKDNHINAAGSIQQAIKKCKNRYPDKKCEVEVENIDDLKMALAENPDIVLLDNMDTASLTACTSLIHEHNKNHNKRILIEASGGYNGKNIYTLQHTGIDFVSMGHITHSISNFDFSMEIIPN